MKSIRPIETEFKGYRFRSLLEARWANFLEKLEVTRQYEEQGFKLPSGEWYLPDFFLPREKLRLEIKPNKGDLEDWPDHPFFNVHDKDWTFVLLLGDPWVEEISHSTVRCEKGHDHILDHADRFSYNGYIDGDFLYYWCECPCCHSVGIQFEGRAARIPGCNCWGDWDKARNTASPRLLAAYEAARQFRPGRK